MIPGDLRRAAHVVQRHRQVPQALRRLQALRQIARDLQALRIGLRGRGMIPGDLRRAAHVVERHRQVPQALRRLQALRQIATASEERVKNFKGFSRATFGSQQACARCKHTAVQIFRGVGLPLKHRIEP
ncbi:hypothetical protein COL8621_01750 [Actibacterium lipolyticum]|uniref:Uncharacterized protein n=1 Tax=Actibacterium lipolyticum TaxID=1524263 RepID=A0A238JXD1_9RHOB|nr:hypothetical protein COL8621_01750 [Actibacterium lipolyticum]